MSDKPTKQKGNAMFKVAFYLQNSVLFFGLGWLYCFMDKVVA